MYLSLSDCGFLLSDTRVSSSEFTRVEGGRLLGCEIWSRELQLGTV